MSWLQKCIADVNFKITINISYWRYKKQKDKTQAKQRRQSSPITYITKHTIEHHNIELLALNKR